MSPELAGDPFDALGHPHRRRIVELLGSGGQSVRDIAEELPISRPAVSRHLRLLKDAGLVTEIDMAPQRTGRFRRSTGSTITGYRVSARSLIWKAGTGETGTHDPLTRTYASGDGPRINRFFLDLYRGAAGALGGLAAREHTAQVDPQERERREDAFRKGDLKLLYCSPTMELGVDIGSADLAVQVGLPGGVARPETR